MHEWEWKVTKMIMCPPNPLVELHPRHNAQEAEEPENHPGSRNPFLSCALTSAVLGAKISGFTSWTAWGSLGGRRAVINSIWTIAILVSGTLQEKLYGTGIS